MSGGGGSDNSAQVEKQFAYDMEAWAYKNDHAQRVYNDAVLNNAIKRRHNEEVSQYKEKSASQQWDYQMQLRQQKHNARVAAYNKSEKMYSAQIGLNQRAASLAFENARNVNAERQNKLAFEVSQSALKFDQERQGRTLEHQGKRAKAAFSSQDNFVKSIQAKGASLATGQTGRSANKRYQSIVAEAGRTQAAMVDGLARADSAYNLGMYGLEADYNMQRTMQGQSKLSILRAYDHSIKKTKFDWFSANVKADANRMSMPTLPPAIPKPLAIPRAIITDPPIPINSPEPIPGAVVTTGTQNTGIGSAIGMVVGAVVGSAIPGAGTLAGMQLGATIGSAGGNAIESFVD